MSRVIPGVAVKVVKDVVVPQLSPAGVLGLVGLVEKSARTARASTWKEFVDRFGSGSAHSMPEARQALENGVTQLVVVPVDPSGAESARAGLVATLGGTAIPLRARSKGTWANGLQVEVTHRKRGDTIIGFDLEVRSANAARGDGEGLRNLHMLPGATGSVWSDLSTRSTRVTLDLAQDEPSLRLKGQNIEPIELDANGLSLLKLDDGRDLLRVQPDGGARVQVGFTPIAPGSKVFSASVSCFDSTANAFVDIGLAQDLYDLSDPSAAYTLYSVLDALDCVVVELPLWPAEGVHVLSAGQDAPVDAYKDALAALQDETDVDLVIASRQDLQDIKKVRELYSAVMAHCQTASEACQGRLGFVQIAAFEDKQAEVDKALEQARDLAVTLNSERMVVVAPNGLLGAVAGRVGNLTYYESPTFKTLAGVGDPALRLGQTQQAELIKARVLAVAKERGRGVIMVKGITTDEDQISVRRVADRAVRGVKLIGDLFIGRLNNEDGRSALKQKLAEFLLQMQKEGAIVPSTDGTSPAFTVDVYSSQDDFSQGIVRVDLAVRPVRAIDYIYATLRVQA